MSTLPLTAEAVRRQPFSVGRRTGVALAGLAVACYAVAVVGGATLPGVEGFSTSSFWWFTSLLAFPLVGGLLLAHRPGHPVGVVYVAVGLCVTGGALLEGVSDVLLHRAPGSHTGAVIRLLYDVLFGISWGLITTYAVLLFPDGRLPSPRWRWVARLASAQIAVMLVAYAVTPGPIGERGPANPLGIEQLGGVPAAVATAASGTLIPTALACLGSLIVRWRRAAGGERRRLAWLALAAVAVFVCVAVGVANAMLGGPYAVGVAAESLAFAAVPLAVAVAILRDGLFDVEVVLDRTLVYLALTGVVLATYAASLGLASRLIGGTAGQGASVLATAVVAVSLSPLKDRLQRAVDRRLFGDRSRPYEVLSALAARLDATSAVEETLRTVTATVARELRLPFAVVQPPGAPAADDGPGERFDLVAQGRSEGTLVVGLRRGQAGFSAAERALLADVARQLAVALRGARLAQDVQSSRERIVRAREEERLRVRRDLHDGIGPVLAAVSLQVDALRDRVADAEPGTRALLEKVKEEIRQCVLDVRRVVEGLRPPALDELGLAGVVREHAAALSAAGLRMEVDVPADLQVRSAAVEVAAYRIVTEAMTNVARHAGAATCRVRLAERDGRLLLEVADDGAGVPPGHRDGVGLASMRERAAELGGTFTVEPRAGGGTRVVAALPLPRSGPA